MERSVRYYSPKVAFFTLFWQLISKHSANHRQQGNDGLNGFNGVAGKAGKVSFVED